MKVPPSSLDNHIQERWARTDRWYRRFRHYLKVKNYPHRDANVGPDLLTVEDYALAFLLECLSLRDWLKKCSAFDEADVRELYRDDDLRLCRDVANALKHMTPLRHPSVDAAVKIDRFGSPGGSGLVVTLSTGRSHDLVVLCQRCYERIRAFLETRGWSVPMLRLVPELGDFIE